MPNWQEYLVANIPLRQTGGICLPARVQLLKDSEKSVLSTPDVEIFPNLAFLGIKAHEISNLCCYYFFSESPTNNNMQYKPK